MGTYALTRELTNISPNEAMEAALRKLPDLGYEVWKTRPLAWLVIANHLTAAGTVNANVSFRPGAATTLSIALACDSLDEGDLQPMAEALAEALSQ